MRDDETKTLLATRQSELARKGATQEQHNAATGKPTRDDCRQYQANWLLNATHGPTGTGALPAFSGRPPYKGPLAPEPNAMNTSTTSTE